MINDGNGILLGLYRESTNSRTMEYGASFVRKRLTLDGQTYEVLEEFADHRHEWRVFDNEERELSDDAIINLFASCNLRRQMKNRF